jgi:hypothetical protein
MAQGTRTINYGFGEHNRPRQDYPVITRSIHPCNWAIDLTKPLIEGFFGLTVGSIGGWIAGWCCGASYYRYCKPAYMMELSEITRWWMMPYTFARIGIVVGGLAGLVLIALAARKTLRQ